VNIEIIEHATRLLNHAPARCAGADELHGRTCRELAVDLPFSRFVELLQRRPDRFVVLACQFGMRTGWADPEREAYDTAMAQAGLSAAPLVMLAARDTMAELEGVIDTTQASGREHFADVHHALLQLLHSAADDGALRDVVGGAMGELETAWRRGLPS
jgi:hypothetical protein